MAPLTPHEATARRQRVVTLVAEQFRQLLDSNPEDWPQVAAALDDSALSLVEELLSVPDGERDLGLLLLAFSVATGRPLNVVEPSAGDLDPTSRRLQADRAVSDELSSMLRSMGIQATSPTQNSTFRSGYDSPQQGRGVAGRFARWLSGERNLQEVEAAFALVAQGIAKTANRAPDLPALDQGALTHARMLDLIDGLLAKPSGGAYEQYLFAALLDAVLEETTKMRAYTKALNATDRSSKTADVEVRLGQNLVAAYEVSALAWSLKASQAVATLLSRPELDTSHIVAAAANVTGSEVVSGLRRSRLPPGEQAEQLDVAVLDLRAECVSLAARATRRGRRAAIEKLHEHLRRLQPRADLVQHLVEELRRVGVTV